MFDFEYTAPTRVVFGKGTENRVGSLLREYGASKVLVHYGSGSCVRSGLLVRVLASITEAGISFCTLGGVVPNPRLAKVREGIALGKEEGPDFILAIGGGSVIDSAKAISYGLAQPDRDVWELFEKKRTAERFLPIGSVVTIAASGSEMSNSCVITNEKTGEKRSYNDNIARPAFAVMNPDLTMSLPDYQTQSGCADIMMHTLERYFTQGGNMELTDALAEGLLRTVMKNALILHGDPGNYEARAEILWAGSLSHNGLTGCGNDGGDFACHGLEHELGGMYDVAHGAGLTAVWPAWARYVYQDCLPRFARFARNVMGVSPDLPEQQQALQGIDALEEFFRKIGMPVSLRQLGVSPTDEEILQMAASCAKANGGKKGSARVLYEEDMAQIYRLAR